MSNFLDMPYWLFRATEIRPRPVGRESESPLHDMNSGRREGGGCEGTKRIANHDKFAGYMSELLMGMTIDCLSLVESQCHQAMMNKNV